MTKMKVVSYTVPKIIWVTVFAVLFLCCKDKVINIMKSNSGEIEGAEFYFLSD